MKTRTASIIAIGTPIFFGACLVVANLLRGDVKAAAEVAVFTISVPAVVIPPVLLLRG